VEAAIIVLGVVSALAVLAVVLLLVRLRRVRRQAEQLSKSVNNFSDRLQQEAAGLATAEERLDSVLAAIEEGFLLVDEENRAVMLNRAAEEMFAYPPIAPSACPSSTW
jgi:PAS domain-containing protein